MRKRFLFIAIAMLLTGLALGCASQPTPAPDQAPKSAPAKAPDQAPKSAPAAAPVKPITLKALTWSSPASETWVRQMVYDKINERAKGELVIQYLGGPEAIPANDQVEALRSGIADMTKISAPIYQSLVPEGLALQVSELTPMEERQVGFVDFIDKLYRKVGLTYFGRGYYGGHATFSKKAINSPRTDYKGIKVATSATRGKLFSELGATEVVVPFPDFYTAMERGMVDAFMMPTKSIVQMGFPKVAKFHTKAEVWRAGVGTMLIGLNAWNKLPKHLQDLMIQVQKEYEIAEVERDSKDVGAEIKRMEDAGMKSIAWVEEDNKWFVELTNRVIWDEVMKLSPENGPKIKELITKKR